MMNELFDFFDKSSERARISYIYKRHLIQIVILEILLLDGNQVLRPSFIHAISKKLIERNRNNSVIMKNTTQKDVNDETTYLIKLGLIFVVKQSQTDNDISVELAITEQGKDILRGGTIHSIAFNALSSSKSVNVSGWSLAISIASAIIAIMGITKQIGQISDLSPASEN